MRIVQTLMAHIAAPVLLEKESHAKIRLDFEKAD